MGNDLTSSGNDLMKQFKQTILNDSWLSGLYNSQKAEQQSEIKRVFTVVADNNFTSNETKAIESRKEVLEDKVERLEAKMAVLEEEMSKNSDKIKEKSQEITNLITNIQSKTTQMEEDHKKKVQYIVDDTFDLYERGYIGKDEISSEIRTRIQNIDLGSDAVQDLINQLDSKQSDISGLVNEASKWIEQKNALQNQYGATKSTYDIINKTLGQIGNSDTNYTNSDYDTKIPVYSLEKTDIISDISENAKINVNPTNSSYKEGSEKPTLESVQEKYKDYFSPDAKGEIKEGDKSYYLCSTENKSVLKLEQAIEKGMLSDLASLGLSSDELKKFFAQNFRGTQIKLDKDGNLNIPKGHAAHDGSRKAAATYDKVANFFSEPTYQGTLNTWDKDAGNTISSNKQIAALANNYESILDKLGKQEPKFTFKEAMYALFGSDNAIFKNAGINYDISKQDKTPSYTITPAGDSETAKMYENLATKIEEIWGVKPQGIETNRTSDDGNNKTGKGDDEETKRTDPFTFNLGKKGQEFAFVIDRDSDNEFGKNEFVGAGSQSWLDDLKSLDKDGDGKLNNDELKSLKVLGLTYNDNAQIKTDDKNKMRAQTTNVQYDLTNAAAMGIEEIDLNGLEQQVNKSTGKFDVNNSEIFSDSFTFKINGQDVTASRKDDTESFMKSVYGDAQGKKFSIALTEDEIQNVMDKDYAEFDQFAQTYQGMESDLTVLTNAEATTAEVKNLFNDTLGRINDEDNLKILRAENKAASFTNDVKGWSQIQDSILDVAAEKGVDIDMEQAKGMYVLDINLSPEQIVDKCIEMQNNEDKINAQNEASKNAWGVLSQCLKEGVKVKSSEIMAMLESGKTNDEVMKELKEKYPPQELSTKAGELDLDDKRTKEIYDSFNKVFNEAGLDSKTVEALAKLCELQQKNPNFMTDKSGEDLAKELLKQYQ